MNLLRYILEVYYNKKYKRGFLLLEFIIVIIIGGIILSFLVPAASKFLYQAKVQKGVAICITGSKEEVIQFISANSTNKNLKQDLSDKIKELGAYDSLSEDIKNQIT